MRKLVVSMNLSLDGFLSGPHRELDWHFEFWSGDMGDKFLQILDEADTLLLGRITYEAMARFWGVPAGIDFPREDQALADKMNRHLKIVFSHHDTTVLGNNSRFAHGSPCEEIQRLKRRKGKNILLVGSANLVSACIKSNMIDEYQLWIHPVILGKGNRLFSNLCTDIHFKLSESVQFESGVTALTYQVER